MMVSEAQRAERIERIRADLDKPIQSQFIREDVRFLLAEVEAAERAVADADRVAGAAQRQMRVMLDKWDANAQAMYDAEDRVKVLKEAINHARHDLGLTAYEGTPVSVWSAKNIEAYLAAAVSDIPEEI